MGHTFEQLMSEHNRSSRHRSVIMSGNACGCFYCLAAYEVDEIKEWTCADTAICPKCGVDTVLGFNSLHDVDPELLLDMKKFWFSYGEL